MSQLDPDSQYFKEASCNYHCDYYLDKTFTNTFTSNTDVHKTLSLFHLNIRSSYKHINKLELYLKNMEYHFNVIGLSETWMKEHNSSLLELHGYKSEHTYRTNNIGGGVSLYIDENIRYISRKDLNMIEDCIETVFIEIPKEVINSSKNIIIGTIYRPPSTDVNTFTNQLSDLFSQIKCENKYRLSHGWFEIWFLSTSD